MRNVANKSLLMEYDQQQWKNTRDLADVNLNPRTKL